MSCTVICRPPRETRQHCRDETQSGRQHGFRFGYDFMQRPVTQAAARQMAIERGKAEGLGFAQTLADGEKTPQFMHHGGAVGCRRPCKAVKNMRKISHLGKLQAFFFDRVGRGKGCRCSVYVSVERY